MPNSNSEIIGDLKRKLHAVVIGINYESNKSITPKLRCAQNDAKMIYDLLCQNFSDHKDNFVLMTEDSELHHKPTLANIKHELGYELTRRSSPDDFVIIFFSGHGTPEYIGQEEFPARYFVPMDADPSRIFATCYSLERDIIDVLCKRNLKAFGTWVIIDCCFSGGAGKAFFGSTYETQVKNKKVLSPVFQKLELGHGWQLLTASDFNEPAEEGNQYSVLTQAVLETLTGELLTQSTIEKENGIELMSFEVIHHEIKNKVKKLNHKQHPVVVGVNCGLKFPILKK